MNILFRDSKFILNALQKAKISKNIYRDSILKRTEFNCLRTLTVSTKFLNSNFIHQNNNQVFYQNFKNFSSLNPLKMKALLIGVFEKKENDAKAIVLTDLAKKVNEKTGGKLLSQLNVGGPVKHCKTRIFYNLHDEYPVLAVVGLGPVDASFNPQEDLDEAKENLRSAIGCGVNAIRDLDAEVDTIEVDGCSDSSAVAEGAFLARYYYDELKNEDLKKKPVHLKLAEADSNRSESWLRGSILAEFQNKCRDLMEKPANLLTPTVFGETAKKWCEPLNVKVIVHDKKWAEEKKMGSFLSVTHGSDEPPKFLELHYNNADQRKPIVFVGKGITFDSGGISLKPGSRMDEMRADMGGAANVLSTIACLASLKAKVNIIGLIPLTENLPSGKATKPGDVVFAMNGKSIQIDNTDAEGRLVLADALCYADTFNPELVVDIATLTGACIIALGQACTACYSTNKNYWKMIRNSGYETGDRMWRMPLYSAYSKKMKDTVLADLNNICKDSGYGGGSATAAGFLKEFVKCENWMHLDMAGTMACSDYKYMSKGMSGRPLRTLVNFFEKNFS